MLHLDARTCCYVVEMLGEREDLSSQREEHLKKLAIGFQENDNHCKGVTNLHKGRWPGCLISWNQTVRAYSKHP
jgi:hypothetical protein